jgi:hypothetical protein|tara:strand:+ start:38 stop:1732 length:1695 start_codon:yes stop_codon:yes gene_type:complete
MAVTRVFPQRQQDPLIQQLLEKAQREAAQASAIGSPSMYAAEAYGGNFPIGTLTAQVLGGIRSRNALQAAQLKQEQSNIADTKLTQALINRQVDGKIVSPTGQFFEATQSADVPLTESNLASALKQDMSGVKGFVTPIRQREEFVDIPETATQPATVETRKLPITLDQIPENERFLYTGTQDVFTPATVDIAGTPKADNFLEKAANFITGKQNVKDIKAADLFELASASGRSPLEVYNYLQAEKEKENKKYKFQNVTQTKITDNEGNIFDTQIATRVSDDGEITLMFSDPITEVMTEMTGSKYNLIKQSSTKGEVDKNYRRAAVLKYLKNKGVKPDEELVNAMVGSFSGDIIKVITSGPNAGVQINELDSIYKSFTGQGDAIDLSTIKTQDGLNVIKKTNLLQANAIESQVNKLGKDIASSGLTNSFELLNKIETILKKYPRDIPGFGKFGSLKPSISIGEDGRRLRALVASIKNITLKERSGAAVVQQELERFKEEMPTFAANENYLRQGLKNLRDLMNREINAYYSSYNPNISLIYQSRPNSININLDKQIKNLYQKYNIKP